MQDSSALCTLLPGQHGLQCRHLCGQAVHIVDGIDDLTNPFGATTLEAGFGQRLEKIEWVAPPFEDSTKRRGHGQPALLVDTVLECGQKQIQCILSNSPNGVFWEISAK